MKAMRNISLLIALLLCCLGVQAAKITGTVIDQKTNEPLIGATVVVKGTAIGTATDVDGKFDINVEAGNHTIEVKYLGYQTKEVSDVVCDDNTPAAVSILIAEASNTQLEEVVVRSSLKKENISALYSLQKSAASVSDGISADVIRRSPDRSTGEVLKRVSGTTIQDNKFVVIRGLSDRYNIALVDNAILPSTEPNRKAFSFDIIPAALIDNVVITKAATPDLPGDFAGGVINILTKEAPEQNYNSLNLGLGYNTMSTGKNFRSGYRSSTDFLGFDNGARQLPSTFPSSEKIMSGLSSQESSAALAKLNNNYSIQEHKALPSINLQGVIGRNYTRKNGNRLGLTAALTYGHNETIKKDLIRQYDSYDYKDNVYTYSSTIGALLNTSYHYGNNKISLKTLYNRLFDDNFLYREGVNNSTSSDVRFYAYDLVQKSLLKTSLEGEHKMTEGKNKLVWQLSYNRVTNNQPDQRKVSYSRGLGNDYVADNTSLGKANNRMFGDLKENILNGAIYYSLPVEVLKVKSNLKTGVSYQYRQRTFSNRYIGAVLDPNYKVEGEVGKRPIGELYSQSLMESGAYYLAAIANPGDEYNATSGTAAAYAMLDTRITDRLRLVWGARYESYALHLKANGGTDIKPVWNDLLPSANFTYSLTEKSNLRASYFRSIARPELREKAPLSYYDYELNANMNGDFSGKLDRSQIDNIDLRYETYPAAGEIFSASVFYKHFNKTLESYVNGQNSSYDISIANYNAAQNIGVEVELRKNLGFIAPASFLKNLSFYVNMAYIKSVVKLDSFEFVNNHKVTERTLSGQSPYVINTSLGYSAMEGKLNFNLLYNRIGQRLFIVGQGRIGNVYESPRNLLDFSASMNITKRSEIRLNVRDLLNNPVRLYFDQDNNGKFEKQEFSSSAINADKDWIYQEYKPGTVFSISYTYKF
jgi:TonB-dependent receptor